MHAQLCDIRGQFALLQLLDSCGDVDQSEDLDAASDALWCNQCAAMQCVVDWYVKRVGEGSDIAKMLPYDIVRDLYMTMGDIGDCEALRRLR